MILDRRNYDRVLPQREAKKIYIFCEGAKREYQYFDYFRGLDSRINVKIYELNHAENNSPKGLSEIAIKCIEGENAIYSFDEDEDEVWLVFDTDIDIFNSREKQIYEVRAMCDLKTNWFVAQSNPCFEVWLYYHFYSSRPSFKQEETCKAWKQYVDKMISGGFDSRKHPVHINTAIANARKNHLLEKNPPVVGSTEVYKLSENIYPLIEQKIKNILKIVQEI